MKKILFAAMVLGVLSMVSAQATKAQNTSQETKTEAGAVSKPQDVGNTICPVSGEKIGQGMEPATYEYKGKIYNFCCAMCIDEFKKDPEKYIKKVKEELQAKTEKAPGDKDASNK